jgi:hypothetical protein
VAAVAKAVGAKVVVAKAVVGEKSIATITDPHAINRLVVMTTMVGTIEMTEMIEPTGSTGLIATAAEIEATMIQAEAAAAHDLQVDTAETKRTPIAGEARAHTADRDMNQSLIYLVGMARMFPMCKSSCNQMSAQTLALGLKAPSRPKD